MIIWMALALASGYTLIGAVTHGLVRRFGWFGGEEEVAAVIWPIAIVYGIMFTLFVYRFGPGRLVSRGLLKISSFIEHGPKKKTEVPEARVVKD